MPEEPRHSDAYYEYDRNDPNRKSPFVKENDGRDEEGRYPADHPSQAFWHDDGVEFIGNPYGVSYDTGDTIVGAADSDTMSFVAAAEVPMNYFGGDVIDFGSSFTGSHVKGGSGEDTITFNFNIPDPGPDWKYNEDKILNQLENYLKKTYGQHYSDAKSNDQTLDKIKDSRKEGFFAGNVVKYIDRYDSKGTPRQDLFKVLHYTMLLINHLNLIEEN